MRDKEYTCLIEPYENALLLTTLNYAYEIRPIEKLGLKKIPKIHPAELKLARMLINKLTKKAFDMGTFKDTFVEQLKKKIEQSKKGKKVKEIEATKPKRKKNEPLLDALKASLIAPTKT